MRRRKSNAAPLLSLDELSKKYGAVALATLVDDVPSARRWSYELKYDGYRILALRSGDGVRLISRSGQDWTNDFPTIASAVGALGAASFVVDGEVCAVDGSGRTSFQLLQNRAKGSRLVYFAFDLLFDGEDRRSDPLEERRQALGALLTTISLPEIVLSSAVNGAAQDVRRLACEAGLEGVIAKERGSAYPSGRTGSWLKLKCVKRQELAVVGWLPLKGYTKAIGALLLGIVDEDGEMQYAGKVGTGFDDKARRSLYALLTKDESPTPTAADVPRFAGQARHVAIHHVAEIAFTEWTSDGHLRHPSFKGLRKDKAPRECKRERPARSSKKNFEAPDVQRARTEKRERNGTRVREISLSHPERVLDPTGLTKLELARYYDRVASTMLPHVRGRPLSLLRWGGDTQTEKGGTFLRHAKAWGPKELRRVMIPETKKVGEYLVVDDAAGLVALAQMDILEVHTWNSTDDDIEHCDRVVFDLDPDEGLAWTKTVAAARDVRERLSALGLESFVKTTGGKGLHVVVPLRPRATWKDCLDFCRSFAERMARETPDAYVSTVGKGARRGKIFVDYLRNGRTATSVAAYSIRARPGAPVSTPLRWAELADVNPAALRIDIIIDRIERQSGDPWGRWRTLEQSFPR